MSCRLWAEPVLVQCPRELSSLDVTFVLMLVWSCLALQSASTGGFLALLSPLVILAGVIDVLHEEGLWEATTD